MMLHVQPSLRDWMTPRVPVYPAMNRWAIVTCPSGAKRKPMRLACFPKVDRKTASNYRLSRIGRRSIERLQCRHGREDEIASERPNALSRAEVLGEPPAEFCADVDGPRIYRWCSDRCLVAAHAARAIARLINVFLSRLDRDVRVLPYHATA